MMYLVNYIYYGLSERSLQYRVVQKIQLKSFHNVVLGPADKERINKYCKLNGIKI